MCEITIKGLGNQFIYLKGSLVLKDKVKYSVQILIRGGRFITKSQKTLSITLTQLITE